MIDQDSSSTETTQTDGDGPDSSDKPHNKPPMPMPKLANGAAVHIPMPPPETGAYEKQPGNTVITLQRLASEVNHIKQASVTSSTTSGSTTSSPTGSESDWDSVPSTRAHSRAPSRAPSMSAGADAKPQMTPTPNKLANGAAKATPAPINGSGATLRAKAPSVHSHDGGGTKFTLKDLLANGPKLARKSSQRSTGGSSRKSDGDSDAGGRQGPRSTAGESTASLSQKYGVCQKIAIGKGATSVVRLAHKWDRSEEKLYAVKEFRKRRKNETEKEYIKKLTAEFCISSTLHHVNIVETVDLVQDESQHWCEVMEFCPGGDLYAAIKKGGMSPSEVECCFKQILSGVAYLHSQGVAHRDIKPENLFFDTKGHLKIGDYGASTVYRLPWETTIHMSTGLCGSEPYIAPEQFLGKPYDARLVDIWACGVVYYCLHFQELPWRAAQHSDAMYSAYASACTAPTAFPSTINNLSPRACRSVIRMMLEPNPKQRAPIEEIMKQTWVQGIEVCHTVEKPKHVHVHARALAQAQLREVV